MTDLSPAQAADRIAKLLAALESRTLDFKRNGDKPTRCLTQEGGECHGHPNADR